ncbi:hypothetical protein D3C73_955230 [compost metagenome]
MVLLTVDVVVRFPVIDEHVHGQDAFLLVAPAVASLVTGRDQCFTYQGKYFVGHEHRLGGHGLPPEVGVVRLQEDQAGLVRELVRVLHELGVADRRVLTELVLEQELERFDVQQAGHHDHNPTGFLGEFVDGYADSTEHISVTPNKGLRMCPQPSVYHRR